MIMAVHVLVANCLMQHPDAFAERSVRAPSSKKFKTDPNFQNMMRYLIDSILLRRRTVQRSTNMWDSASYLQLVEDNRHEARPSRSQRSLAHADRTAEGSSAGPPTSRRRVISPCTDRARQNTRPTATTSSRHRSTLNVSGIRALADSDDDEDTSHGMQGKRAHTWSPLSTKTTTSCRTIKLLHAGRARTKGFSTDPR